VDDSEDPMSKLIFNFIKERNKYNESHDFTIEDWEWILNFMDTNTKEEECVADCEDDWTNFKAHPDDGDADAIDFAGVVEKL